MLSILLIIVANVLQNSCLQFLNIEIRLKYRTGLLRLYPQKTKKHIFPQGRYVRGATLIQKAETFYLNKIRFLDLLALVNIKTISFPCNARNAALDTGLCSLSPLLLTNPFAEIKCTGLAPYAGSLKHR